MAIQPSISSCDRNDNVQRDLLPDFTVGGVQ